MSRDAEPLTGERIVRATTRTPLQRIAEKQHRGAAPLVVEHRRKRIEVTLELYVETDASGERVERVLGTGGDRGKRWAQWLTALKREGCKVNEHWHTIEHVQPTQLVQVVGGELAEAMREGGGA